MYIDLVTINLCPGQGGGGVKPSGTLDIVENGVYNVYSYSSASVDVHPSISLSETYISNGSYNITGEFNGGVITVDVPAPQFITETLNVSTNGTYTPGEGVDGYSQVVVDVPQSVTGYTQKEITEGTLKIINLDNSASFVTPNAFKENKTIQTVNLPNCTSVGDAAFYSCKSLRQVSLPVCSSIMLQAFANCSSLSQVNLPMCSYISYKAFYSCSSLSQVNLPVCSHIGNNAFYRCYSLTQVNLPVCSHIEDNAFYGCSSLSQVNLPVCSYIGNSVFFNCFSLSQVSIPLCEYIGSGAFRTCSLLSLSLPVCSYIGGLAFYGCSSLSIITIGYSGICSLGDARTFETTQITSSTGSIYVPASLVDAYKSATNWSYFSTQIFPIPE